MSKHRFKVLALILAAVLSLSALPGTEVYVGMVSKESADTGHSSGDSGGGKITAMQEVKMALVEVNVRVIG